MKKIITLLFAIGAFTTSFAQSRDDAKDVILGRKDRTSNPNSKTTPQKPSDVLIFGKKDPNNTGTYPNTSGDRQAQVDQVNREYDAKIASVRNNPYLSESEKQRTIDQLNKDRARRIREINGTYRSDRNGGKKHHDGDNEDEDNDHGRGQGNERSKAKGNNGNHYGWEKGKGNPHRNGGKPGKN
jgi:hypothetical protein